MGEACLSPRRHSRPRGSYKLAYRIEMEGLAVRVTDSRGNTVLLDADDWSTLRSRRFSFDGKRVWLQNNRARKPILLARHIMGATKDVVIDHINGDPSDNRRLNLRVCSAQENARNMALPSHSSTGFKGVSRAEGVFRAYAYINKKQVHLGRFASAEDAAHAYDNFARRHFGEFACVNFANAGEQSVHRGEIHK